MRFDFYTSIITLVVLLQSTVVNAEVVRENACVRYGVTRTVELQADNKQGAPCRVVYHKAMEDQSTTILWNAKNDAQFCSTKYDAFIVKLETELNWSCELIGGAVPSLVENKLPPKSSTVTPVAPDDDEIARNEYATAVSKIARPVVKTDKRSESSDIREPDLGMVENASSKAAADSNDIVDESLAAIKPDDSPVSRQSPELALALSNESSSTHYADSALSMKQIEYYIPSGNYVSYKEDSRSDNSSLCPADGLFIWRTQSPDKPVFDMGAGHEFQFDLTSVSDLPIASVSRSAAFEQCQPEISAGYCANEKYIGDTPLHPVLSSYFGCDGRSVNSQNHRPLVLVRTVIDSNSSASECKIAENYQHLALAPSLPSSGSAEPGKTDDIELVILPKRTSSNSMNLIKGFVCRYVRSS